MQGMGDIENVYLTITDVNINFKGKSGIIYMNGYVTKEKYLEDRKMWMCKRGVHINATNFDKFLSDSKLKVSGESLLKNLYLLILDEPEYQNAISDI